MRNLIEDLLLANIRWPTKAEVEDLSAREKELDRLLNAKERVLWWLRHRDFHRTIFELSPEKIIVAEAMRLWSLTDRYRSLLGMPKPSGEERSVVDKRDLVQALADHDRARVVAVRADRRRRFETLVLDMLESRGL
jgi:DNA-binding GntR family transcriptional regulator